MGACGRLGLVGFHVRVLGRENRQPCRDLRRETGIILDDPKLFHITSQLGSIADNTSGSYYFYRISKAALNMFNKSFSQDYPNITSIVLHPGWVRTDMGGKNAPVAPEQAAKMLSDLILRLDKASTGQFLNYRGEILSW